MSCLVRANKCRGKSFVRDRRCRQPNLLAAHDGAVGKLGTEGIRRCPAMKKPERTRGTLAMAAGKYRAAVWSARATRIQKVMLQRPRIARLSLPRDIMITNGQICETGALPALAALSAVFFFLFFLFFRLAGDGLHPSRICSPSVSLCLLCLLLCMSPRSPLSPLSLSAFFFAPLPFLCKRSER